jgi:hypothetical protein
MSKSKTISSLAQAIGLSLDTKTSGEMNAKFKIEVENKPWDVYAVSISHRDILCYCNEGTATFLVDTYGERNAAELFNWENENE